MEQSHEGLIVPPERTPLGQKFDRAPRGILQESSLLPKFNTLPTNIFLGWCWRAKCKGGPGREPRTAETGRRVSRSC